eukprot:TRINITY_DN5557_c0_g2_i1.p1 TRINITY_DN5557_c0_g2~~TRINITY_DN5557_c0_g2_i1.p1  ORF type:complete len:509 (+),score=143.41 TRINITY_DN5557_c0_g2_i1:149-1675(+)
MNSPLIIQIDNASRNVEEVAAKMNDFVNEMRTHFPQIITAEMRHGFTKTIQLVSQASLNLQDAKSSFISTIKSQSSTSLKPSQTISIPNSQKEPNPIERKKRKSERTENGRHKSKKNGKKEEKEEDYSSGDEFVVDQILKEKKIDGEVHFFIRWKDYDESYDSWEPLSAVQHLDMVKDWMNDQAKKEKVSNRKHKKEKSSDKISALRETAIWKSEDHRIGSIGESRKTPDGSREFLINWKGMDESCNTWEPIEKLSTMKSFHDYVGSLYQQGKLSNPEELKEIVKKLSNPISEEDLKIPRVFSRYLLNGVMGGNRKHFSHTSPEFCTRTEIRWFMALNGSMKHHIPQFPGDACAIHMPPKKVNPIFLDDEVVPVFTKCGGTDRFEYMGHYKQVHIYAFEEKEQGIDFVFKLDRFDVDWLKELKEKEESFRKKRGKKTKHGVESEETQILENNESSQSADILDKFELLEDENDPMQLISDEIPQAEETFEEILMESETLSPPTEFSNDN